MGMAVEPVVNARGEVLGSADMNPIIRHCWNLRGKIVDVPKPRLDLLQEKLSGIPREKMPMWWREADRVLNPLRP